MASDIRIVERERRRVNGLDMLMIRMEATISGAKYTFMGHYYTGDYGSVQVVAYTSQNLFTESKRPAAAAQRSPSQVKV